MDIGNHGFVNGEGRGKPSAGVGMTNGLAGGMTNGLAKGSRDGVTNGMTNGLADGMVNGLTNGKSRENLVDGGTGKLGYSKSNKKHMRLKWFTCFAAFILVSTYFIMCMSPDSSVIAIDGTFNDWEGVPSTDIGVAVHSSEFGNSGLNVYLRMDGLFDGDNHNVTDGLYVFIDDKNETYGYNYGYKSYEYVVQFAGVNGEVVNTVCMEFDETTGKSFDWSGFINPYKGMSSRAVDGELEFEIRQFWLKSILINENLEYTFVSFDIYGNQDVLFSVYNDVYTGYNSNAYDVNDEETRAASNIPYSEGISIIDATVDKYALFNRAIVSTDINTAYYIPYEIIIYDEPVVVENDGSSNIESNEDNISEYNNVIERIDEISNIVTYNFSYSVGSWSIVRTSGGALVDMEYVDVVEIYDNGILFDDYCGLDIGEISVEFIGNISVVHMDKVSGVRSDLGGSGSLMLGSSQVNPLYNSSMDYNVTAFWTDDAPVIDGIVNETSWNGVGTYYVGVDNRSVMSYFSMNETRFFCAIIAVNDTNRETLDKCGIYFDPGNNRTRDPDENDKMLTVQSDNTTKYLKGDGNGWVSDIPPVNVTGASYLTDVNVSWEFSIGIEYMDEFNNFSATDEWIGFGFYVIDYDSGTEHWTMFPDYYYQGSSPSPDYPSKPDTWAHLFDGSSTAMSAYITSTAPTIDGTHGLGEWSDADTYTVDLTKDLTIYTMRDATYCYIALHYTSDGSSASTDVHAVYFDTAHDATTTPDADDKMMTIDGSDTITYWEGGFAGWSGASLPFAWDAAMGTTGGSRSSEFRMTLSELDENGLFSDDDEVIGFGCYGRSEGPGGGNDYWTWWPDNYYAGGSPLVQYADKPDTWGDLVYIAVIPEFNEYVVMFMVPVFVGLVSYYRKRKGRGGDV